MNHTDETGRLYVDDTPVYAKLSGGVLHCMIRCTDEATFEAVGLQVGLLRYENPAQDAVVDPETGEEVTPAVPASGAVIPTQGNTVTRLGSHVITPAVLDEEGNEVTPAVMDDRFHVNFWLSPEATKRGEWESWIVQWMAGTPGSPNANETAVALNGVELIDPLSVSTPFNVLL